MAAAPLTIKLRVTSWKQLAAIYKRDLTRSAVFLKTKRPPPLGTKVRINMSLPSDTLIVLAGIIHRHIPAAGLGGRGPGVDIKLNHIPQSAMWLIESALSAAKKETSQASPASTDAAQRQRRAPTTDAPKPAAPESDMDAGEKLVEAEEELIAALKNELEALRKLNPFQILNIKYEANDQQVRAAFGALTKKYHPDRFARFQSNDARELASEIFILIRNAYRQLGESGARAKLLNELRTAAATKRNRAAQPKPDPQPPPPTPPPTPPPARPAKPAASGPNYASADTLLDVGKYNEALAIYRIAARKAPGDRTIRARIDLAEGLRALAQQDRLEAAQRFEAVLEKDPNNERAARELANMRRQATTDRKGLMARLLGKKKR